MKIDKCVEYFPKFDKLKVKIIKKERTGKKIIEEITVSFQTFREMMFKEKRLDVCSDLLKEKKTGRWVKDITEYYTLIGSKHGR